MDVKEFLYGYEKCTKQLKLLMLEKERIVGLSEHITIDPTKEHVASSGNKDVVGNVAAQLAVISEDIEDTKNAANEEAHKIFSKIQKLDKVEEAQILELKHLHLISHKEIQKKLLISEATEFRRYRSGLMHLQKILDKDKNNDSK